VAVMVVIESSPSIQNVWRQTSQAADKQQHSTSAKQSRFYATAKDKFSSDERAAMPSQPHVGTDRIAVVVRKHDFRRNDLARLAEFQR